MTKRIKVKEGETITDDRIERAIKLLNDDSYKTKKAKYEAACGVLNIKYNVARLDTIVENYKQDQENAAKRRKENRGKPASQFEIQAIIEGHLDGESYSEISKRIYRTPAFVKEVVEKVGVPQKPTGATYWEASLVPEPCRKDEFEIGQIVWSARRHCMAIVIREEPNRKDKDNKYYQLWIIEPIEEPSPYFPQYQEYGGYFDGSYAYDMASLEHFKEYGVDIYRPYRPHFKKWLEGR